MGSLREAYVPTFRVFTVFDDPLSVFGLIKRMIDCV